MDTQIVTCKHCGCKLRLPINKGMLAVTCPKCQYQFRFDSGPRIGGRQAGGTQARSRTVSVHRLTHSYKEWNPTGLGNMLKDKVPIHIFVDDQDQGILPQNGSLTLNLNEQPHILKCAALGSHYKIPAGSDSYDAYFFNNSLRIAPVNDFFRYNLTSFVLKMFRSKGIKERILDYNNLNHNIEITVTADGIRLSWRLARTKGLKQWSTGKEEEKISYYQAGLTPPPKEKQPDGYWGYLQMCIEDAIESDPEADMERYNGGFRPRLRHNLY